MNIALILLLNLAVGACIGLTGIAGFLLPMFYTGFLGMPAAESLALSFSAFLISGILGAVTYYKAGNLAVRPAVVLSAGSLLGALAGVRINLLIPEDVMQIILYAVVLISGVSILLRRGGKEGADAGTAVLSAGRMAFYFLLGIVTGAVCAASGAGGPVLVMPLLVVLGIPVRMAVGVSLFNMIFISIPAFLGYLSQCFEGSLIPMLGAAFVSHGLGVWAGSLYASRINQVLLKRGIAVFSVLIALWKLFL